MWSYFYEVFEIDATNGQGGYSEHDVFFLYSFLGDITIHHSIFKSINVDNTNSIQYSLIQSTQNIYVYHTDFYFQGHAITYHTYFNFFNGCHYNLYF